MPKTLRRSARLNEVEQTLVDQLRRVIAVLQNLEEAAADLDIPVLNRSEAPPRGKKGRLRLFVNMPLEVVFEARHQL